MVESGAEAMGVGDMVRESVESCVGAYNLSDELSVDTDLLRLAHDTFNNVVEEHPESELATTEDLHVKFVTFDDIVVDGNNHIAGFSNHCPYVRHNTPLFVVGLNSFEANTVGYEMYERTIRHELAHAECEIRHKHSVISPTDGEEEFEKIAVEFDGSIGAIDKVLLAAAENNIKALDYFASISQMDRVEMLDFCLSRNEEKWWDFTERYSVYRKDR